MLSGRAPNRSSVNAAAIARPIGMTSNKSTMIRGVEIRPRRSRQSSNDEARPLPTMRSPYHKIGQFAQVVTPPLRSNSLYVGPSHKVSRKIGTQWAQYFDFRRVLAVCPSRNGCVSQGALRHFPLGEYRTGEPAPQRTLFYVRSRSGVARETHNPRPGTPFKASFGDPAHCHLVE